MRRLGGTPVPGSRREGTPPVPASAKRSGQPPRRATRGSPVWPIQRTKTLM